jgi:hypothetical protein
MRARQPIALALLLLAGVTRASGAQRVVAGAGLADALRRFESVLMNSTRLAARDSVLFASCAPRDGMPVIGFTPGEARRQRDEGLWRIDPKAVYWVSECAAARRARPPGPE